MFSFFGILTSSICAFTLYQSKGSWPVSMFCFSKHASCGKHGSTGQRTHLGFPHCCMDYFLTTKVNKQPNKVILLWNHMVTIKCSQVSGSKNPPSFLHIPVSPYILYSISTLFFNNNVEKFKYRHTVSYEVVNQYVLLLKPSARIVLTYF